MNRISSGILILAILAMTMLTGCVGGGSQYVNLTISIEVSSGDGDVLSVALMVNDDVVEVSEQGSVVIKVPKGVVIVSAALDGYDYYYEELSLASDYQLDIILEENTLASMNQSVVVQYGDPGAFQTVFVPYSNSSNAYKNSGEMRVEFSDDSINLSLLVPVVHGEATVYVADRIAEYLNEHTDFNADYEATNTMTAVVVTRKQKAADKEISFAITDLDDTGVMFSAPAEASGAAPVAAITSTTVASGSSINEVVEISVTTAYVQAVIEVTISAGDSAIIVAERIGASLAADEDVSEKYDVSTVGAEIVITQRPGHEGYDNIQFSIER